MSCIDKLKAIFDSRYETKKNADGVLIKVFKDFSDEIALTLRLDELNLKSKESVGQGGRALVPIVRIFSESIAPNAKSGLYVTYLFSADGKSTYLTLNQGTTDTDELSRKKLKETIQNTIRTDYFDKTTKTESGKIEYNESAIFSKKYEADNLPKEEIFVQDLKEMVLIYQIFIFKDEFKKSPFKSDFEHRFVKSLIAKSFVILAGNSGTGKTKTSLDFAKWLGLIIDNTKNYLLVPVGADWTDNTNILGFYNPVLKQYEPTQVLKFILAANKNSQTPFFLIFDEMNLSHVERYFSDFLSAMESGEEIILYKRIDKEESEIPEKLTIPNNLFVVGTVNIDETTYMFSPKVLDRANVIEFIPNQEDVLSLIEKDNVKSEIVLAPKGTAQAFFELVKGVRNRKNLNEKIDSKKAKEILTKVYEILKNTDFEFAFRTAKEIRLYLNAAFEIDDNFNLEHVIDEQVLQKILPKIHGNRKEIKKVLEDLNKICDEEGLTKSKTKILKMLEKLDSVQYASFM